MIHRPVYSTVGELRDGGKRRGRLKPTISRDRKPFPRLVSPKRIGISHTHNFKRIRVMLCIGCICQGPMPSPDDDSFERHALAWSDLEIEPLEPAHE